MNAWKLLAWVLRLTGVALLFALPAVFAPRDWFVRTHAWLGLGAFPEGPVILYLIRSISAGYALSGAFLILVSFDLRRHATVIAFLGIGSVLFGALMTVVDAQLGLPWWWIAAEGPPAVLLGILILALGAKARERIE